MTLGMSIAVRETVLMASGMSIALRETVLLTSGMSVHCHREYARVLKTATKPFPLMSQLIVHAGLDTELQHCMWQAGSM